MSSELVNRFKNVDDPKRRLWALNYFSPRSEGFAEPGKSALLAGYSREKASAFNAMLTRPKWASELMEAEALADAELIYSAEQAIRDFVESPHNDRYKLDAAKFALERIHRSKWAGQSTPAISVQVADFSTASISPQTGATRLNAFIGRAGGNGLDIGIDSKVAINANGEGGF
jgi:hypothetical protein